MSEQLYRIRPIEWVEVGIYRASKCGRFMISKGRFGVFRLEDMLIGQLHTFNTEEQAVDSANERYDEYARSILDPVPNPAIDRSVESV